MKEIELKNIEMVTLVDDEDYERASQLNWYGRWDSHINGWRAYANVKKPDGKRTTIQLSQFLMEPEPGQHVDHISGDALDNRKLNLRCCSPTENRRNSRPVGTSKYKGVSRHQNGFVAQATFEKQKYYLGYYPLDKEKEAALAYDVFAMQNLGEFAWLNQEHYPEDFVEIAESGNCEPECLGFDELFEILGINGGFAEIAGQVCAV